MNSTENLSKNLKWYIFPILLFLLGCPTEDDPPPPSPPPSESYDCIDNACIDPGDGTGEYDTCPESCTSPEEFIQMGWADLYVGSYEDAMDNFDEALGIDSLNVSASMGKAWCLFFIDSGNTLDLMKALFETGVSDSMWAADAYCGLSIVTFAQGNNLGAINYADSLLSIDTSYVFNMVADIGLDHNDIRLVKAQAQFMTSDDQGAYVTLSWIDSVYEIDDSSDSIWVVNGIPYFSFESALAALIALVSSEYNSGGFISSP